MSKDGNGEVVATEEVMTGRFIDSLKRNNKQIRNDRAEGIAEDAQITFKREVEDLELKIKRLSRDRENMLDLSPENAQSLILGKDFDSRGFVDKDLEIGTQIHNLTIKLEIARKRYNESFGGVSWEAEHTMCPIVQLRTLTNERML